MLLTLLIEDDGHAVAVDVGDADKDLDVDTGFFIVQCITTVTPIPVPNIDHQTKTNHDLQPQLSETKKKVFQAMPYTRWNMCVVLVVVPNL